MRYGITRVSPSMAAQEQRITALPSDPQETLLARYLVQLTQQNKVGTPEYYLAAGEFQNRQKMRQEQAAKQQQGPKVVENLTAQAVQKAAPQMAMAAPMARGVGALDAGGMDRIESPVYTGAMGGIVAFDEGGQAKSDSGGDQIEQLYTTNLMRASDPEGYRFWSQKFGPDVDAAERALFIAEAAPEVQRRVAAGETNLPEFMRVDPAVRRALQSKDITTDEYKTLANYFGNQWIGGEAEDPASLTRRDYIERPRTGYDLATFLASRSQQHGAQPDTKQRFTNLMTPFMNVDTSEAPAEMRYIGGEGNEFGYVVTNPLTGEREMAYPSGALGPTQEGRYRTSYGVHHSSIGDPDRTRYAVGLDYLIDPKTGRARLVEPYLEGYQERRRDNSGLISALGAMAGAYLFPTFGLEDVIGKGITKIGTNVLADKVEDMASGGEVKRYQGQGPSFVQSSTSPFMRDVQAFSEAGRQSMLERTPGMMGRFNRPLISPEEDERMRLIQMLNQKFGPQGSLIQGYFMNQSPEQREYAKDIVKKIPTMSLTELRNLAGTAPTPAPGAASAPAPGASTAVNFDRDFKDTDTGVPTTPAQATPFIPRSMQMGDLAPPVPSLDAVFARARQLVDKSFGAAPKEISTKQGVGIVNEALREAGFDPKFHQEQIAALRKEKEGIKGERKEATDLRLIEMGLGILGGESPYFGVNVGKGASPALKGLAEDFKDIKKIDRERDKAIRDLQTAEQEANKAKGLAGLAEVQKSRERVDRANELRAGKEISVFNTLSQITSQERIAGMPGALERMINRLPGDTFGEKFERYSKLMGPGASSGSRVDAAILQDYVKNPWKLDLLKDNPATIDLYNYLKAQIAALAVPSAISAPTGKVRE